MFKLSLYEDPIKSLVLSAKFTCSRQAATRLGVLIAHELTIREIDVITWVPTAQKRVRYRGFDHAKRLAQPISEQFDLPLEELLTRQTARRQLGASRQTRRNQLQNEFKTTKNDIRNKRVLLVDDVVSTGASIEACAEALWQAGVSRIYVAVATHNR